MSEPVLDAATARWASAEVQNFLRERSASIRDRDLLRRIHYALVAMQAIHDDGSLWCRPDAERAGSEMQVNGYGPAAIHHAANNVADICHKSSPAIAGGA